MISCFLPFPSFLLSPSCWTITKGLTERFDAEYFPFFFWVCIWAGLMHIISAMIGLVSLVWKVTPFTSQIFELFIATTFIYSSLRDLVEPVYFGQKGEREDRAAQYAGLMLGLLTFSSMFCRISLECMGEP